MMTLQKILQQMAHLSVRGTHDMSVTAVCADSRAVVSGTLFVAVRGTRIDGHAFIKSAIEAGATSVICEKMPDETVQGVTFITVTDASVALGVAASAFYDNPSSKLTLTGVTGTN